MERGVPELNLSECCPGSVAERVGVVSGLRSSAAFFTFLRANLALSPSAMASAANTPIMSPSLQPPHPCEAVPSPLATSEPLIPLDDIPPLSLDSLHSQTDKAEGLELVADSVAEMKQRASSAVLLNPLSVMGVAASWAAVYWYCYVPYNDGLQAALLGSGVTMLYWAAVRLATGRYESFSKTINWDWLRPDFGQEQDVILGARFGGSLVGALVLRLEPNRAPGSSPKKKSRSRSASLRGGKGIIRAWVTKLTHRRQGVGKDMLREAVRVTKERCGKDAQIGFAAEHAHSTMFLPTMFNGAFRRNEVKAAKTLVEAVTDWEGRKRKR